MATIGVYNMDFGQATEQIAAEGITEDGTVLVFCKEPERRALLRQGVHQWRAQDEAQLRVLVKRALRKQLVERGETSGYLVMDPERDQAREEKITIPEAQ